MHHVVLCSGRSEDRALVDAVHRSHPDTWSVTVCTTHDEALEVVQLACYDVCLVDERFAPDSDALFAPGLTTAKPVLVLIETADDSTDDRWLDVGVWECLVRSELTPDRLRRSLRRACIFLHRARLIENRSVQAQKMEAIGRLAGGVVHDFNNLLTAITGYASLMSAQIEPSHPWREHLDELLKVAERGSSLTAQLGGFNRERPIALSNIDLNTVVRDMYSMLHRLIGEHIAIDRVPASDLGLVRVDPDQISRVLMNLAINARDAMPNGGRLIIETANVDFDPAQARTHPGSTPRPYVMLTVTDTGIGMTGEVSNRVFEPFFTTKAAGVGLGLSTVYSIVRQCGGDIYVYSEPDRGTTFKVYLPRIDDVGVTANERGTVPDAVRGYETVLLVEDDFAVRDLTSEVLVERGYQVLTATNGREALATSNAHQGEIDLVLSDVVMPVMSGPEFVRLLRWTRPKVRVIFTSGYPDQMAYDKNVFAPTPHFLQKPFAPDRLLAVVRQVLDET
jgi:two-component system, cell cycle sensor histidine kinase and response regulator CckA